MKLTSLERAGVDLIVADLDYKYTIWKVAESIADIRNVLQWEAHRIGAVSAGVLLAAVERLEFLMPKDSHPLDGLHINQGSFDAAADAYEAEYNKAHGIET